MKTRLTILLSILVAWGVVAILVANLWPLPEARLAAAPTRTPQATFTTTATATITLTPSPTPTATPTPTVTPVPTDTPLPTATETALPAPSPNETLSPTTVPTATLRPVPRTTAQPTKRPQPKPTRTPAPPFVGQIVGGHTHCGGYAGVTGVVKHANDDPYSGVAVGVWSDTWEGRVSLSEDSGKFEVPLGDIPPGAFRAAVVKLASCSQMGGRTTAKDCQFLSNVIRNITVSQQCEGSGANQVTEIEFSGP